MGTENRRGKIGRNCTLYVSVKNTAKEIKKGEQQAEAKNSLASRRKALLLQWEIAEQGDDDQEPNG